MSMWTASFPEDDPWYQFFLACDRIMQERKRAKDLAEYQKKQVEKEDK